MGRKKGRACGHHDSKLEAFVFRQRIQSVKMSHASSSANKKSLREKQGQRQGQGRGQGQEQRQRPRLLITENGKFMAAIAARIRPRGSNFPLPPPPPPSQRPERIFPLGRETFVNAETTSSSLSLSELAFQTFSNHVEEFLDFPSYVSSILALLPSSYTSRLSHILSTRGLSTDVAVRTMAMAGTDAEELALWGPLTDVSLEMLSPRIVHIDDEVNSDSSDWEDSTSQHHLSGFTSLKRLEICDTASVSILSIVSLLSQPSMSTLIHLSLRNTAGRWHGDDGPNSDESNRSLIEILAKLPNLKDLDLRNTWLAQDFEKSLRSRLRPTVNVLI